MLPKTHLGYNEAVFRATTEEILLNVVRLRYSDAPLFLAIDSITSQFEVTASVSTELGVSEREPTQLGFAGIGYSEKPTISFSPRTDEDFSRKLLSDVSLASVVLIASRAREIDLALTLLLRELNGNPNVAWGSNERFREIVRTLSEAHRRNDIQFGSREVMESALGPLDKAALSQLDLVEAVKSGLRIRSEPDGTYFIETRRTVPVVWIDPESNSAGEVLEALNLEAGQESYPIRVAKRPRSTEGPGKNVNVVTRSLAEVLNFLSQSVDIPAAHAEIAPGETEGGAPEAAEGFFRVRVSDSRPDEATLAVQYRDHWYFLPDSDIQSRRTFLMLTLLFGLEVGPRTHGGPTLTLPLN